MDRTQQIEHIQRIRQQIATERTKVKIQTYATFTTHTLTIKFTEIDTHSPIVKPSDNLSVQSSPC